MNDLTRLIANLPPEKRAELLRRLERKERTNEVHPPATGQEPGPSQPLSFAQQRLWLHHQLEPGSVAYNLPTAFRLLGRLDADALERGLQVVVARHESLRTTFRREGDNAVQVVSPEASVRLERIDLGSVPAERHDERLHEYARTEAQRPFDLGTGPLLRASLLRLGEREHVLLVCMHHIVTDGWSFGVLLQELLTCYEALVAGRAPELPPLPLQYSQFAQWQRERLQGTLLEEQLSYWRKQLEGAPAALELPTSHPRPPGLSGRGGQYPFTLPGELAQAVKSFAAREGATSFMVLLAAYGVLLSRYSGQEDLCIGTPSAGREHADLERLIGFFVNTLVVRARPEGTLTFRHFLREVREATLGALAHQELPLQKLLEELRPPREPGRTPLFQVSFSSQVAVPVPSMNVAGLEVNKLPISAEASAFELNLMMAEHPDGFSGRFDYSTDLFEPQLLARMAGHLTMLLEAAVASPDTPLARLPLLTEAERHQVLVAWNDTRADFPRETCLHTLIEAQVARTPDAVAVVAEQGRLTYRQLDSRSNQLAWHLRSLGVGPEVRVGVCAERSLDMVIGLLAVLKAGGAYVPLDPSLPRERLAFMLEDSSVPVLLLQERLRSLLPELPPRCVPLSLDSGWEEISRHGEAPVSSGVTAENLAYAIYTSGSTGRPKLALNGHRAIVNRLLWMQEAYRLTAQDVVLQKTPYSFDVSVWEFFWPLLTGARLVMARPEGHKDPTYLRHTIQQHGVTTLHFVPSMLQAFIEEPELEACTSLHRIICSGEALPHALRQHVLSRLPVELHNLYGPTEAAVDVSFWACVPGDTRGVVPIGRPISNTRLYVLDGHLQPVPVGVHGELYIGGVAVGRGYHARPELTAERFLPDPFSSEPGAHLYRTGDRVRLLPDGNIDFLGRMDFQVKVRGFRIEPGEVEAALGEHPGVGQCVVLAREDGPGGKRLVAYVVARPGQELVARTLREQLEARLPEHMVPSAFVVLQALPLTPNGKVDRKALPAPEASRVEAQAEYVAPRTPTEEVLAGVFAQVLGLEKVGAHDSFFTLGGHSLLATQTISRLRSTFGVELPVRALFEAPTVARLASRLESLRRESSSTSPQVPPLVPMPREGALPLSFAQQRLWFLDQLEPGSPLYNIPAALLLEGPLDVPALEATFQELLRRHESLRTVFPTQEGQPVQVILPPGELPLTTVDLSALPEPEREQEARRLAREAARHSFLLASRLPVHLALLKLAPTRHLLVLVLHHIVSDGWSLGVLVREVAALYAAFASGNTPALPPLPLQYPDFALWQRSWLRDEALSRQLDYWKQQLSGAPLALELPTDRPRPPVQTHRGAWHPIHLPPALSEALAAYSRQQGATLFMTLLAAFQTLLHRYSGQADIIVGSPIAGRNRTELEGLIGFFVNTLALRAHLGDAPSFRALLARVRETTLGAHAHQDLPFERLVEELHPARDLSRSPIFQVMFVLQNAPAPSPSMAGLSLTPLELESGVARFDLSLTLRESPRGLLGALEYNTDLFDAEMVARMAGHFHTLLAGALAWPELPVTQLPLLSEAERHRLLVEWNDTRADFPAAATIPSLFAAQVERTPDATALVSGESRLTYRELRRRARSLAHRLRSLGVGPESVVGLHTERSLEMVVGMLGILEAGGAYLPLDPSYPVDRLAYMLEDSRARVLVTQRRLEGSLPPADLERVFLEEVEDRGDEALASSPSADQLAYLLYTSGSTGRPKGVLVPHHAVVNCFTVMDAHLSPRPGTWLAAASFSFDISVVELLWTLTRGFQVVLQPTGAEPRVMAELLARHGVTHFQCTPSLARALSEEPRVLASLSSLRQLLVAGEALMRPLAERLRAAVPGGLLNLYGPTEATIYATTHLVAEEEPESIPIGKPLANTRLYILDPHLHPVPIGVAGELYIGGAGVVRGYLGRPELTAERFLPDFASHEPGARMYRTGDRARWRADGTVEFLGRLDFQVKVRGFRIELGELEAVLEQHPATQSAVVVAREEVPGDTRLVAYLVARPGQSLDVGQLRTLARQRLPEYMVPSSFLLLEALPLNPNGKLDRQRLPAPEAPRSERAYVAPGTPTETLLAGIWARLLGLERVGLQDDFFELGGHSLLATRALWSIRETFQVELSLKELFEAPTLAGMAARIDATSRPDEGLEASSPRPVSREGSLLPSFAQQRMWFLEQLQPGSAQYNIHTALRLEGSLDLGALERTFQELIRRHESLRTTVVAENGMPVLRIAPNEPLLLPVVDLSEVPEVQREEEVLLLSSKEIQRPFDFARGPLVRITLLRLEERAHVLLLTMHHLVSDGWSMGVLVREVSALYEAFRQGRSSPLPELPIQYADFAAWQRTRLRGEVLEAQLAWWREQLEGAPRVLELPTDRPRPAVQTARGGTVPVALSGALSKALVAMCRREGATPSMALLAAWQLVLARYSGQDELCVGVPIAGRVHAGTENLIGLFVNTLVLRTRLAGNPSFQELLGRVRATALGAYAHQELPFDKLVEELKPERDPSRSPLVQVMFVHNMRQPELVLPGLEVRTLQTDNQAARFDLALVLDETAAGYSGVIRYNVDLFDEATVARLAGHFRTLLEAAIARPGERIATLPLLTDVERRQLLVDWNDTDAGLPPEAGLHGLVEQQAARTPDAIALLQEGHAVTYAELEDRATRLARLLRRHGVGPESLVALCTERSPELLVGILGILKAGGAYVPLDPSLPRKRLAFILEDTGAKLLLTQRALREELPHGPATRILLDDDRGEPFRDDSAPALPPPDPDRLAYVLYTSGSTGTPKGVQVTHRAVLNHLAWRQAEFPLIPEDAFLQKASCGFDISVLEMFAPLRAGARLVLARPEGQKDSEYLAELVAREKVTVVHFGPAPLAAFLETRGLERCQSLRYVFCGGEPLSPELWRRFSSRSRALLVHQYGPTETCIDSTAWRCERQVPGERLPIGRPIANTRVYVLDPNLQLVSVGAPGELYIGGVGLARGYIGRPELTAERFIPDPFATTLGERLYRTGDKVRWLADGTLEFLGRLDEQVKLRGFRIELGEIEATLRQHPLVRESVLIVREDSTGDKQLVAYVVAHEGQPPTVPLLRGFLRDRLPDYMVPSAFVFLPALPLSTNGKVDKRALPAPERSAGQREQLAPRDPLELVILGLFEEMLGTSPLSVRDDFFELGGHSLLAVRLMAHLEERTGQALPLDALFQASTAEKLASLLRQESPPWSPLVPIQPKGTRLPFFCVHPVGGNVLCYAPLARLLGPEQPFHGLQAQGMDGRAPPLESIADMARLYVEALRTLQPQGPYRLGGWSLGAVIAFEMACLLHRSGETVELLALIEPSPTAYARGEPEEDASGLTTLFAMDLARLTGLSLGEPHSLPAEEPEALLALLQAECHKAGLLPPEAGPHHLRTLLRVFSANFRALRRHTLSPFPGTVHLLRGTDSLDADSPSRDRGWGALALGGLQIHEVPGDHYSLLRAPRLETLARQLTRLLEHHGEPDGLEPGLQPAVRVGA